MDTTGKYPHTAKCILEMAPNLSRSKVCYAVEVAAERQLGEKDRPPYKYEKKKNGKRKEVSGRAKLKINQFPEKSESLEDDLRNKELETIVFLGEPLQTDSLGIEGIDGLTEQMTVKIKKTHRSFEMMHNIISQSMKYAKENNKKLKANFSYEDRGEDKTKIREIDLDKSAFQDQLFSKKIKLEKDDEFPGIYENIDDDVVKSLIEKLHSKDVWND